MFFLIYVTRQFLRRFAAKVKQDVDERELSAKSQRESFASLRQTSRGKVSHDRVKGKSGTIFIYGVLTRKSTIPVQRRVAMLHAWL